MKLAARKLNILNGYDVPKRPNDCSIHFNINGYNELDFINAMFRGEKLHMTKGPSSDHLKEYYLSINGVSDIDYEFQNRWPSGTKLIWGQWMSKEDKESEKDFENDFIGFLVGTNGPGGLDIFAELEPKKTEQLKK